MSQIVEMNRPRHGEQKNWRMQTDQVSTSKFVNSAGSQLRAVSIRTPILRSDSALEAIGLFSPWFSLWVAMLISGVLIGTYNNEIESKARSKAAKRLSELYSARH